MAGSPGAYLPVTPLSTRHIEDYLTLAQELEDKWDSPQAASALRRLVMVRHYEMPDAAWLQAPGIAEQPAPLTGNPFFPHLPATSWRLLVRDL